MSGGLPLTTDAIQHTHAREPSFLSGRVTARNDVVFIGCVAIFMAALCLGGGTREGFLGDVVLQFTSIGLLIPALSALARRPRGGHAAPGHRHHHEGDDASVPHGDLVSRVRAPAGAYAFCAMLALVPLLQVVPLPARMWTQLPGRDVIAGSFELLGDALPWWPISMVPQSTWLSFFALIPPLAVFLGALSLSYRERRLMCYVLLGFGVLSVFLGLLQLAQGPQSDLRFFEFTNPSEAVGFFANRNHYSALLYVATAFAACWAIDVLLGLGSISGRKLLQSHVLVRIAAALTIIAMLVIAQTMARSRAGLLLSILTLVAVVVLALRQATDREAEAATGSRTAKVVMGTIAFAVVFSLQFALYRILDRFAVDPLEDARVHFARKTFALAKQYFPLGTGVGTFVPVYAINEKPGEIAAYYANRAHNDVLEVALETGAIGIALMLIFALWLSARTYRLWKQGEAGTHLGHGGVHASDYDRSLMRAATLALWLLALHSFVDYPLRTSALMVVAAFCCALLFEPYVLDPRPSHPRHASPVAAPSGRARGQARGPGVLQSSSAHGSPHAHETATPKVARARQAWVSDKELPESWRKTDLSKATPETAEVPHSIEPDPANPKAQD